MGYYSDVRVSTTKEGFEFLKSHVTSNLFSGYGYVEVKNDDNGVVFGWDGVKWYGWFHEVAEFKNLLFVMNDKGIPYEYLTVGEDNATEFEENDSSCCDGELVYHLEVQVSINVYY